MGTGAALPHVYRTLKQMDGQGWITSTFEHPDGKPSRRVYRLTPDGEEAFRRWLDEPPVILEAAARSGAAQEAYCWGLTLDDGKRHARGGVAWQDQAVRDLDGGEGVPRKARKIGAVRTEACNGNAPETDRREPHDR